jgi:hypothetical protein
MLSQAPLKARRSPQRAEVVEVHAIPGVRVYRVIKFGSRTGIDRDLANPRPAAARRRRTERAWRWSKEVPRAFFSLPPLLFCMRIANIQ